MAMSSFKVKITMVWWWRFYAVYWYLRLKLNARQPIQDDYERLIQAVVRYEMRDSQGEGRVNFLQVKSGRPSPQSNFYVDKK